MRPLKGGELVTFNSTVIEVPALSLRFAVAVGFTAIFAAIVNRKMVGAIGAGFFPVTVTLNAP